MAWKILERGKTSKSSDDRAHSSLVVACTRVSEEVLSVQIWFSGYVDLKAGHFATLVQVRATDGWALMVERWDSRYREIDLAIAGTESQLSSYSLKRLGDTCHVVTLPEAQVTAQRIVHCNTCSQPKLLGVIGVISLRLIVWNEQPLLWRAYDFCDESNNYNIKTSQEKKSSRRATVLPLWFFVSLSWSSNPRCPQ